jgi:tetratricopeptide (TPR) repeat protein
MVKKVCENKLKKRPNDKNALWVLSNLYINYNKCDEAGVYFETLLNQGADNKAIRLLLARVYYKQKQYEKVNDILQKGKVLESNDKENYYLGDSLLELRDYKASINYLVNYLNNNKSEYVPYVKLGYAYYMLGLFELAIDAYESAKKLKPGNVDIIDSINMCMNELKKGQTLQ